MSAGALVIAVRELSIYFDWDLPRITPMPNKQLMTFTIDCGGLSLKASVLDAAGTLHAQPVSIPTPYPLSPTRLIKALDELAALLPAFDRITVGMPGMIRHGVVVTLLTTSTPKDR
jgi:polyphosphate glucokinase